MTNARMIFIKQFYPQIFKTFFGLTLILLNFTTNTFAVGGDVDTTFKAGVTGYSSSNAIRDVVVQPDGRIIITGGFTVVNGIPRSRIARLNADGSLDTSFNASLNGEGQVIIVLPDGKIMVAGSFGTVNDVTRSNIVRLNSDGSLDTSFGFVSGINNGINAMVVQPDGKIIIGGQFGTNTTPYYLTRINPNGTRDAAFDQKLGVGANGALQAVARQADGKILIGGTFTKINNVNVPARIARLNEDGTVDQSFNPGGAGADAAVHSIRLIEEGKILVGGQFDSYNTATRYGLVRLAAEGSLDTTFSTALQNDTRAADIEIDADGKLYVGGSLKVQINSLVTREIVRLNANGSLDSSFNYTGNSSSFRAIALQLNGDIVYGGSFETLSTQQRTVLAQLKPNGSLDNNFAPVVGKNESANTIAVQPDGKILIGGRFSGVNDRISRNLARLNADGTLDTGFNVGNGFDNEVFTIAVQTDGKILVGGQFTNYNGVARSRIARLNADGSLDTSFTTQAASTVQQITVLPNNQIMIAGVFDRVNNTTRTRIALLNADGSLDASFNPENVNGTINSFALQTDGKIVIGGSFNSVNGVATYCLARLNADGTHDTTLATGAGFNSTIEQVQIAGDKIIAAGQFNKYNNVTVNYIVRLNADGSRDTDFNTGAGASSTIYTIVPQTDGRILVGGTFFSFNGATRNRLVRLNADGSLDESFKTGTGANSRVNTIAVQEDGRILIGGDFDTFNEQASIGIARLSAGSKTFWTGAANSDWTNAANWVGGIAPTASDSVVVEDGNGNAPVLSGNLNITSLEIKSNAQLEISAGASLSAQGIINNGHISGGGTLKLAGATMVNNGTLSIAEVETTTSGTKALSGSGSFVNNVFRIKNGAQVRLDSDHMFEKVLIQDAGSTFNISSRTVRLRGAGQALKGGIQSNFSTVIYEGTAPQIIPTGNSGNFYNLTLNNTAGFSAETGGNLTASGTLNLQNGVLDLGTQTLVVGHNSSVIRTNGYVIGKMQRYFDHAESYTFPTGTTNGYSPVTVSVTSGTTIVTAKAVQSSHASLPAAKSLQRFWTLTGTDTFTADLTFAYTDADVAGNEANYRIVKINGGSPQQFPNNCPAICVNAGANTATITGVSSFSDWSLTELAAPTSAPANFGGRIRLANNQPLAGVTLTAISSTGQSRTTTSDVDGNYQFAEMPTASTYTVTANRAGYTFAPSVQFVNHTGERDDVNFVAAQSNVRQTINDYDGDGKTDIAVFRPSEGNWYILLSGSNSLSADKFGAAEDLLVPADYDADGKTDVAVFRAGVWYVRQSARNNETHVDSFGQTNDVPVPADYTGDGKADLAVYRAGVWFIKQSENGQMKTVNFGLPTDKAVPADYDADGKIDVAVFRAGVWYVLRSSDNQMRVVYFGDETDTPLAADYTGDGKADFAIFRNGNWYVKRSDASDAEFDAIQFGTANDLPLKGDFDGDGKTDVAVYRGGTWHVRQSGSAYRATEFGLPTDKPLGR